MSVTLSRTVNGVRVTVVGDDPAAVERDFAHVLAKLSGEPAPSLPEAAKPVRAVDAAADPSLEQQRAKDKALKLLVGLYSNPATRPATKGLLKKYGVSKFGEIPAEKGPELLADAEGLSP